MAHTAAERDLARSEHVRDSQCMHAMLADAGKKKKIQFIVLFFSGIFYCFVDSSVHARHARRRR